MPADWAGLTLPLAMAGSATLVVRGVAPPPGRRTLDVGGAFALVSMHAGSIASFENVTLQVGRARG